MIAAAEAVKLGNAPPRVDVRTLRFAGYVDSSKVRATRWIKVSDQAVEAALGVVKLVQRGAEDGVELDALDSPPRTGIDGHRIGAYRSARALDG